MSGRADPRPGEGDVGSAGPVGLGPRADGVGVPAPGVRDAATTGGAAEAAAVGTAGEHPATASTRSPARPAARPAVRGLLARAAAGRGA